MELLIFLLKEINGLISNVDFGPNSSSIILAPNDNFFFLSFKTTVNSFVTGEPPLK